MNKENIHKSLHFLIPIAEEWGIEDDGYRCEKIYNSSTDHIKELVKYFTDEVIDELDAWLGNQNTKEPQKEEYYKFSALYMAFEYAASVLDNRLK